jgi:hypothetical protein
LNAPEDSVTPFEIGQAYSGVKAAAPWLRVEMLPVLVCGSPSRTRVERGIHSRPSDSPESDTLGTWAGIILHNADGGGLHFVSLRAVRPPRALDIQETQDGVCSAAGPKRRVRATP